jgi:TRAP-type C4-dicarboxylate transport system permease small subunit
MKRFNMLDKVLEIATFITFLVLIIVVVIQVITRFLPFSFIWSVELSRYLFIYSIAFAAPLAIRRGEFVSVDIILNFLPRKLRKVYETIIYLVVMFVTLIIGIQGLSYMQLGATQYSRTMPIPMSVPYASIFISAFLMFIYAGLYIYDIFTGRKEDGDHQ